MLLKKIVGFSCILQKMEWERIKNYKYDFVFRCLSKTLYLFLNLLFWFVLGNVGYNLNGWTINDLIVFIAFSELFFGLDGAIFSMASRFWRCVYSGVLDTALTRPIDPRIRFIVLNINYVNLYTSLVEFFIIILLSGRWHDIWKIAFASLIVLFSNVILAEIRLVLSYLSFWHGKMDAVCEVCDSLTLFNKYPLNVMGKPLIVVFQLLFPFYFFSTFSAEIINFEFGVRYYIFAIAGIASNILLWNFVNNYIWEKGLLRYESVNG